MWELRKSKKTPLKTGKNNTKNNSVCTTQSNNLLSNKRKEIKKLFGLIEWDSDYDYKKQRVSHPIH